MTKIQKALPISISTTTLTEDGTQRVVTSVLYSDGSVKCDHGMGAWEWINEPDDFTDIEPLGSCVDCKGPVFEYQKYEYSVKDKDFFRHIEQTDCVDGDEIE